VRLHGQRDPRGESDGNGGETRRIHALGAGHRGDQVGRAGHEHDVLALAEMLVGQHGEQEQQHRWQKRLGEGMVGGRHEADELPAGPERGEDARNHPRREPEGDRAGQEPGRQHGQSVHDEGQRQILVQHLDIELLAADPARRHVEDGGHVVVDGREEIACEPEDRQREQRYQQELLDTRRNGRRFGVNGWQGGVKIS
jgi:hypothetical protein